MKESLLSTKLHQPQCRPGVVLRPRLMSKLDSGLYSRFILISAPAGFGKTSLLSQWLSRQRRSAAWISLDRGDNDPVRFLRYLIAAVQSISAGAGQNADILLSSTQPGLPEIEPVLTLLINELDKSGEQIIIVFDDYHEIENMGIHSAVSFFIDNAPSNAHVVIATRSDPPLPLARWRARGQMIEIRANTLRFLSDEIEKYFACFMGETLSSKDMAVLAEKTEGWAAGLQMAALYMQGRGDLSSFIMEFSGGHRYIMDYLIEEVLQRQSEEVQAFLLQTSILEKLNGSLCDMVTGQTNGQQMLELLENANMFIVPLDDRRGWYRYHRLFADLLKARLFESRPGIADKLHHRAAQWYANSGMMNEAVTHSLSAHDYEGTVNLLEQAAMPLLIRGELDTLDRWRLQIPQEILYMRPRLCVHLAWLSIFTGRIFDAELFLEHARNKLERNVSSVQSRDILGSIAAQSAFIADMRGDTACALDKVKEASGLLDKDNLTMRSVLPFVMARAYRLDGDLEGSLEQLGEVSGIARENGNILTLAVANYEIAAVRKIEGKLQQAADIYEDTLRIAYEQGARHFGSIAKIDAGMSEILCEWNDLKLAEHRINDAIIRMKSWKSPTDLVIAYIVQSRVLQARGDAEDAVEILKKAEQIKHSSPLFQPLGAMIASEHVKLWLEQGNLAAAALWLGKSRPGESGPLIVRELEQITAARVLLAQEKTGRALSLLASLGKAAEQGGRYGKLIEILVLKALAYQTQENEPEALTALGEALYLAEPEGYMRVFIDEGLPIAELLFKLMHRRSVDAHAYVIDKDYLSRLIAAIRVPSQEKTGGLSEELSEREKEVLRLMARGMTNKQIASELFVTAGTVKAHTANIYRKLDAANRTQAIALARDLKLLI